MQAVAIENSYPVSIILFTSPSLTLTQGWISGGWSIHWRGGAGRPSCHDPHHRWHAWCLLPQGIIMIILKSVNDMSCAGIFLWIHGRKFSAGQHCLLVSAFPNLFKFSWQVFNGVRSSEQICIPHAVHGRCKEGGDRWPWCKLEMLSMSMLLPMMISGLPRRWTDVSLQCPPSPRPLRVSFHLAHSRSRKLAKTHLLSCNATKRATVSVRTSWRRKS